MPDTINANIINLSGHFTALGFDHRWHSPVDKHQRPILNRDNMISAWRPVAGLFGELGLNAIQFVFGGITFVASNEQAFETFVNNPGPQHYNSWRTLSDAVRHYTFSVLYHTALNEQGIQNIYEHRNNAGYRIGMHYLRIRQDLQQPHQELMAVFTDRFSQRHGCDLELIAIRPVTSHPISANSSEKSCKPG